MSPRRESHSGWFGVILMSSIESESQNDSAGSVNSGVSSGICHGPSLSACGRISGSMSKSWAERIAPSEANPLMFLGSTVTSPMRVPWIATGYICPGFTLSELVTISMVFPGAISIFAMCSFSVAGLISVIFPKTEPLTLSLF